MLTQIKTEDPRNVARAKLCNDAIEPGLAHAIEIGRRQPQRGPFRKGLVRRADFHPVLVVRAAIGLARGDILKKAPYPCLERRKSQLQQPQKYRK